MGRKAEAVTCWIFVEEEDLLDVAGELRHDLVEGGGELLPAAVPPVDQNRETRYLDNRHIYTSDIYTSTILHVWYRTIILDFAELHGAGGRQTTLAPLLSLSGYSQRTARAHSSPRGQARTSNTSVMLHSTAVWRLEVD